jgi:metal-responsive CopG/Arc/MetJ family transcriptional regulator
MNGISKTWKSVNVLLPLEMVAALDSAALRADMDRSKFVRRALREKLARDTAASLTTKFPAKEELSK